MSRRALRIALACLALAACQREDPARLEAEKAAFLASTVPRDEYWHEVERKGVALREQHAAEQRSARATAERAQVATAVEQMRPAIADARNVNAQIAAQIAGFEAQTEKARARQRTLESFLARTGPPDVAAPAK